MRLVTRFVIVFLSLVAACAPAPPADASRESGERTAGFPRRVVDASGRAIDLPAAPQRIVSQTLGTDELLIAMVDHQRIVGVSTLARNPAYSNVVKEVSALPAPAIMNAEQVIRLRPDLVFVASFSRAEIVTVLEASGAPVYRFANFDRLDDVRANIRRVGEAVGAEAAAATLIHTMDERLARIKARRAHAAGAPPRVLSYSASGFTAGAGTTWDDIVHGAVAINVAATEGLKGFPRISAEQVLAWQPDYLVAGVDPGEQEAVLRRLRDNPAIAATAAVKAGRVIFIDNRAYLSVSHHVVDAVEALADALDRMPVKR
jgi:iron complex transport system substrate-binding protein